MQRLGSWLYGLFLVAVLLLSLCALVVSATGAQFRYVHGDSPCPGLGTDAAPACRIQSAVDAAQCGDTLRVRATVAPYTEQVAITRPSCPASSPVFLEPDRYQEIRWTPQKTAQSDVYGLLLRDVDGWVVRGLTLEGSLGQPRNAVLVQAAGRSVSGISLAGLRILDWNIPTRYSNSAAIAIQGNASTGAVVHGMQVLGNQVVGFRKTGLSIMNSVQGVYRHNAISGGRCGPLAPGLPITGVRLYGIYVTAQTSTSVAPAFGDVITHNTVADFQPLGACLAELGVPETVSALANGIAGDTGPTDVLVAHNTLTHLAPQDDWYATGIYVEARCHRWRVEDNLLRLPGAFGIQIAGMNLDVVASRNVIERPVRRCVVLQPGPASQGMSKRRVVVGNTCTDPGVGAFKSDSDLWLEEDTVEQNSWQLPAP